MLAFIESWRNTPNCWVWKVVSVKKGILLTFQGYSWKGARQAEDVTVTFQGCFCCAILIHKDKDNSKLKERWLYYSFFKSFILEKTSFIDLSVLCLIIERFCLSLIYAYRDGEVHTERGKERYIQRWVHTTFSHKQIKLWWRTDSFSLFQIHAGFYLVPLLLTQPACLRTNTEIIFFSGWSPAIFSCLDFFFGNHSAVSDIFPLVIFLLLHPKVRSLICVCVEN